MIDEDYLPARAVAYCSSTTPRGLAGSSSPSRSARLQAGGEQAARERGHSLVELGVAPADVLVGRDESSAPYSRETVRADWVCLRSLVRLAALLAVSCCLLYCLWCWFYAKGVSRAKCWTHPPAAGGTGALPSSYTILLSPRLLPPRDGQGGPPINSGPWSLALFDVLSRPNACFGRRPCLALLAREFLPYPYPGYSPANIFALRHLFVLCYYHFASIFLLVLPLLRPVRRDRLCDSVLLMFATNGNPLWTCAGRATHSVGRSKGQNRGAIIRP